MTQLEQKLVTALATVAIFGDGERVAKLSLKVNPGTKPFLVYRLHSTDPAPARLANSWPDGLGRTYELSGWSRDPDDLDTMETQLRAALAPIVTLTDITEGVADDREPVLYLRQFRVYVR